MHTHAHVHAALVLVLPLTVGILTQGVCYHDRGKMATSSYWSLTCDTAAARGRALKAIQAQMQQRQTAVKCVRCCNVQIKLEWKKEATKSTVLHYARSTFSARDYEKCIV